MGGVARFLAMDVLDQTTKADVVINLFVYLPFGLLTAQLCTGGVLRRVALASLTGLTVSVILEFGQTFLPGRVTALSDIVLNTAATMFGAAGIVFAPGLPAGQSVLRFIRAGLRDQTVSMLGIFSLILWVLAQWSPFVPSLDMGNLRQGLAPFKAWYSGSVSFSPATFIQYVTMLAGLCTVAVAAFKPTARHAGCIAAGLLAVLAGKIIIISRVLTPEALLAWFCILPLALTLRYLPQHYLGLLATCFLGGFYGYGSLLADPRSSTLHPMNWVPFRGQMNSLTGLMDLLNTAWVFAALAYALYPLVSRSTHTRVIATAGLLLAVFILEWQQQTMGGRYADITDVVVAIGVWWAVLSYPHGHLLRMNPHLEHSRGTLHYSPLLLVALLILGVLGVWGLR